MLWNNGKVSGLIFYFRSLSLYWCFCIAKASQYPSKEKKIKIISPLGSNEKRTSMPQSLFSYAWIFAITSLAESMFFKQQNWFSDFSGIVLSLQHTKVLRYLFLVLIFFSFCFFSFLFFKAQKNIQCERFSPCILST